MRSAMRPRLASALAPVVESALAREAAFLHLRLGFRVALGLREPLCGFGAGRLRVHGGRAQGGREESEADSRHAAIIPVGPAPRP